MASAMVNVYVDLVEQDLRTLESVPQHLRAEVSDILNSRRLSDPLTIQSDNQFEDTEKETEGAV